MNYSSFISDKIRKSLFDEKCYFNPSVPSVHFLDVFPLFLTKTRCSSQRIFLMKPSKSPLTIFLSICANFKIIEKRLICEAQKNSRLIWPEKKIFWLFYAETSWKCFWRRKKYFLKKIFLEIFGKFGGEHQSGAAPSCDNYTPKSSSWHFYL